MLPAKQPHNAYHMARNGLSVVSLTPELEQPPTIGLKPLPGMSGWWWQNPTHKEPGGIWRSSPRSLEQALPWCPEVLSRLTAIDINRTPHMDYFTIRVHNHIATLSQTSMRQGHGWQLFPTIDLRPCIALTEQLINVIHAQAEHLPRIDFYASLS